MTSVALQLLYYLYSKIWTLYFKGDGNYVYYQYLLTGSKWLLGMRLASLWKVRWQTQEKKLIKIYQTTLYECIRLTQRTFGGAIQHKWILGLNPLSTILKWVWYLVCLREGHNKIQIILTILLTNMYNLCCVQLADFMPTPWNHGLHNIQR